MGMPLTLRVLAKLPSNPAAGPSRTEHVRRVIHGIVSIPKWRQPVEFEFDAGKSAANAAKHGIDFVQAQQLWQDPMRVDIPPERLTSPDGSWSGSSKAGTGPPW